MDRRSFLKMSGLTAGFAALAGSGLVGCGTGNAGHGATSSMMVDGTSYSVYDTDILLVGGGYAGTIAMYEAARKGYRAIVVEKAPFGFGGGAGMNWDVNFAGQGKITEDTDTSKLDSYIRNNELQRKSLLYTADLQESPEVNFANWGEVFARRKPDGTMSYYMDIPGVMEHSFPRHYHDHFGGMENFIVHDYTMVTDILIDDKKRCVGALGLHLPTGEYRIYRARATVTAPGGCTQFYGWHTVSCTSNNTADNTADTEMALMRHGGKIGEAEFSAYDLMGIYPTGFACSNGSMVAGDSMHITALEDVDGKLFTDYGYDPKKMAGDQDGVIRGIAAICDEGKGTESGGVYLRCTAADIPSMKLMYRRNIDLLREKFNFDVTKERIEVIPEMYEHGGAPVVDNDCMSVDFPGLFCIRGGGVAGSEGGNNTKTNRRMAPYAMKNAIAYASSVKGEDLVPFDAAAVEIKRLEELRTRQGGNLRPVNVRRNIQKACAKAMMPIRREEDLEAAKTELDRIMEEDIPKMACSDTSRAYNIDWKDAIETINLLDMARVSVQASLDREESRAALIRPEFPETDDANWKCMLAYTLGEDGSLTYEKIPY